jgi:hypothetical protein
MAGRRAGFTQGVAEVGPVRLNRAPAASKAAQSRDFARHQFLPSNPSYEQQTKRDQRSNLGPDVFDVHLQSPSPTLRKMPVVRRRTHRRGRDVLSCGTGQPNRGKGWRQLIPAAWAGCDSAQILCSADLSDSRTRFSPGKGMVEWRQARQCILTLTNAIRSPTVWSVSASRSEISMLNSSSSDMIVSTISRLVAPRSASRLEVSEMLSGVARSRVTSTVLCDRLFHLF